MLPLGPPPKPNRAQFPYQGTLVYQGMPIYIENKAGSIRRGKGWAIRLQAHYGEFAETLGSDGDPLDCFIGPNPASPTAYVVRQVEPDSGKFDELKILLGYDSAKGARAAYEAHYDRPGFFGGIVAWPISKLKEHLRRRGPRRTAGRMEVKVRDRIIIRRPMRKAVPDAPPLVARRAPNHVRDLGGYDQSTGTKGASQTAPNYRRAYEGEPICSDCRFAGPGNECLSYGIVFSQGHTCDTHPGMEDASFTTGPDMRRAAAQIKAAEQLAASFHASAAYLELVQKSTHAGTVGAVVPEDLEGVEGAEVDAGDFDVPLPVGKRQLTVTRPKGKTEKGKPITLMRKAVILLRKAVQMSMFQKKPGGPPARPGLQLKQSKKQGARRWQKDGDEPKGPSKKGGQEAPGAVEAHPHTGKSVKFRHESGELRTGTVHAFGDQGATVQHGGKLHQVHHGDYALHEEGAPAESETTKQRHGGDVYPDEVGPVSWDMALDEAESALAGLPEEHAVVFAANGKDQVGRFGPEYTREVAPHVDPRSNCAIDKTIKPHAKDGVFTHNHPTGAVPSYEDLVMAGRLELSQVRAVRSDGQVWVVDRPEDGWPKPQDLHLAHGSMLRQSTDAAARAMDAIVTDAGGDPQEGINAKGFDLDKWYDLCRETQQRAWGPANLGTYGLKLELQPARPGSSGDEGDGGDGGRDDTGDGGGPVPAGRQQSDAGVSAAPSKGEAEQLAKGRAETLELAYRRALEHAVESRNADEIELFRDSWDRLAQDHAKELLQDGRELEFDEFAAFRDKARTELDQHDQRRDLSMVGLTAKDGTQFRTGQPVTFRYTRNLEGNFDLEQYGKDLEPLGTYVYHLADFGGRKHPSWEQGEITLRNPLVIEWVNSTSAPEAWKARLSYHYGGKVGKALSQAIRLDGHDGIVTVRSAWGECGEIVDLRRIAQPPPRRAFHILMRMGRQVGLFKEYAGEGGQHKVRRHIRKTKDGKQVIVGEHRRKDTGSKPRGQRVVIRKKKREAASEQLGLEAQTVDDLEQYRDLSVEELGKLDPELRARLLRTVLAE